MAAVELARSPHPVGTPDLPRRILVLILVALTLAGLAFGAFMIADGWWALSWVGYTVVGGVVLMKRAGNTIGRLLLAVGLCWSINFAIFFLLDRFPPAANAVWLEMTSSVLGYTAWILVVMIPVLFPTGNPSDRLTRVLRRSLMFVLLAVVAAELVSDAPKELTGQVSPLAVPALTGFSGFMLDQGFFVIPLLLLTSLISLVVRWRRAVGAERLQYRWFVGSLVFVILSLLVTQLIPEDDFIATQIVFSLCMNLIPVAIGVAVLRYRLYEIDRIVSRTVGYALVIGILGLVYGAGAVWLPSLFVGEQPDLFVAGATLLAAASFSPLRKRVLGWIDRRFYRSRYDAEKLMADFSQEVGNQVDVDRLAGEWISVVARTMQPSSAGVWVRGTE